MAKNKKIRGHYCFVCDTYMANEKFSGKGHANHICKKCSKLPVEERNEKKTINKIYSLYQYTILSKVNRQMLNKYCSHNSEKVRGTAIEVLDHFKAAMMEQKLLEELEHQLEAEYFEDMRLYDEDTEADFEESEMEYFDAEDYELPF